VIPWAFLGEIMTTFSRIKEILDKVISDWDSSHHRRAILSKHDLGFGWSTRQQLLNSTAFDLPLITQDNINNRDGENANIVVALRTGVAPYPRMPIGGPYVSDSEINEIVDWINNGAPE
jgi:hypothetical protein